MRSPHLALCVHALAAYGFMLCTCHAHTEKAVPPPNEFSIRSYPLPVLHQDSMSDLKPPPPEMPPPEASQVEKDHFLKRSHEMMKEYILGCGLDLPPGSLTSYDPATGTLCVRTTNSVHSIIEALSDTSVREAPKYLSWRLEIVEAASADVRATVKQCQGRVEHDKQLDELLAKGVAITTMRGETKGGQQMTARQGRSFNSPVKYSVNAKGQIQAESEPANRGVQIELDPVLGENGLIDLNCLLQYWPTAPKARLAQITAGSAPKVEVEWLDLPAFTTKFSTTFQSGNTRLLGVWELDTLGDHAKTGRSQAVFFCAHSVSRLHTADPRLELILRERGEALVPTPKTESQKPEPKPEARPPAGMIIRVFRVPVDFETMSGSPQDNSSADADGNSPADPFATNPARESRTQLIRRSSAEEILKSQGIPFPPGSYARMSGVRSRELIVCNLPEFLDLVEAFLQPLCCWSTKVVHTTVEIIEADASLLRRLARETESHSDHTAAMSTLEAGITAGKAKVFRTAWIETRGGQQATCENVILTKTVSKFGFGPATLPAAAKKEGEPETKSDTSQRPDSEFHVDSEEEHVGLNVEVDPVIGEDGVVDLNLLVKVDTAPMNALEAAPVPPPGTQRLATVNTTRAGMSILTSMNLHQGIPRLVGLYQPTTAEGPAANVLHAVFVRTDIAVMDEK